MLTPERDAPSKKQAYAKFFQQASLGVAVLETNRGCNCMLFSKHCKWINQDKTMFWGDPPADARIRQGSSTVIALGIRRSHIREFSPRRMERPESHKGQLAMPTLPLFRALAFLSLAASAPDFLSLTSASSPALLPASCPPAPPEMLMFPGAPSPGPRFFSLGALSLAVLPQPQGLILRWSPVTTRYLAEQAKLTVILGPLFPPSSRDSHQALWVLLPSTSLGSSRAGIRPQPRDHKGASCR